MPRTSASPRGLLPSSEQMEVVRAIGTTVAYSLGVDSWYALCALGTR